MSLWDKLTPKQKRLAVFGLAGLAVALIVIVLPDKKADRVTSRRQSEMTNFLTDTNTRSLGIDGLGVELRKVRDENRRLQVQIEALQNNPVMKSQVDLTKLNARLAASLTQMNQLAANIETLRRENQRLAAQAPAGVAGNSAVAPDVVVPVITIGGDAVPGAKPSATTSKAPPDPDELFNRVLTVTSGTRTGAGKSGTARTGSQKVSAIRLIEADPAEIAADEKEKAPSFYLPAGSMMTGVLLTGLDAPTGTKTRSEPYPVLVRIKHEAILPNQYRANFRECFILAGGYGDLSSERAFLRAERLSCVREGGGVVDVPLDAYAAGEDGKVGLRGTLVSKQGQVLNKALIAGVAQGFSQAFQSYRVPVLSTNGNSDAQFQSLISPEAVGSAALNGVGTALEKLADFYLSQAEQMFPVIEIHAGRRVTFVLTSGRKIDAI